MVLINSRHQFYRTKLGFSLNVDDMSCGVVFVINSDQDLICSLDGGDSITLHFEDVESWPVIYRNYTPKFFKLIGFNSNKLWNPEIINRIWDMLSLGRNVLLILQESNCQAVLRRMNILFEMSKLRNSYFNRAGSLPPAPQNH
ncbi:MULTISPECIES: hypothetical protein [Enterobacteriaceae]|uniref:hypothetical protein n=1 Tax=Enterobacteriaceae TaxID=543 RepID=UPI000D6E819B|nr:hypothetical protein [Escherichia coli]HBB0306607.1 hypothetical protein [Escherichia coli]HED3098994.1 hypothetical protein [Citrobacter freundii]